mmetsp:Transcript_2405/g.3814  ORF Transcript_2405/g.3814 Transcript_2405/m.3814 type:complete len:155 (+) Transcript_2405:99-563(+)
MQEENNSPKDSPQEKSRSRSRSPGGKAVSLLVRNLDYSIKPDEIKSFFSKYGEIRDVYIPRDYYSQRPRGFGFVEFQHYNDAKTALESLDATEFQGSTIRIVFAREGRKSPTTMRRREKRKRRRSTSPRKKYRSPRRRRRSRSGSVSPRRSPSR